MGGDQFILDQHQVGRRRALSLRLLQNLLGNLLADHCALPPFGMPRVPPTVSPSILIVGSPTPTGTPCPSFPHVPTPSSSFRSLPTMVTRVRTSGPWPISVAPLTGFVIFPSSIMYASLAEKTNLPLVMSTWPPPKVTAYRPCLTEPMISSEVESPGSMKVLVMRGSGWWA